MTLGTLRIDSFLSDGDLARAFRDDVHAGLLASPRSIPPKWFYDARGSELFEEITLLPEYYPTRREREILDACAPELAALARPDTIIELGSGMSAKTTLLLDALAPRRFVAFDVCHDAIVTGATMLAARYPTIEISGVVGDFERHLGAIPRGEQRLVAFLGSTIGNLDPAQRAAFLTHLAEQLEPGEQVLLGADLVKEIGRLEAAYNDAQAVTAAFNLNLLDRMNRELGANFAPDRFSHVARWNAAHERIEIWLRSETEQHVTIPAAATEVRFGRGEKLHTEISTKFRRDRLGDELSTAGFDETAWWTDRGNDFSLSLWTKR